MDSLRTTNGTDVYDAFKKRRAAYALNLLAVSTSSIIDYNDTYIMEQEYHEILNNLNLQNYLKDESLLGAWKEILDNVIFFKIAEQEKKFLNEEYQRKIKAAIWSAVPSFNVFFTAFKPNLIKQAVTMAMQIGTAYMNYRRTKSQIEREKDRQDWELHTNAVQIFHGLRTRLFETAWRLADKYEFDDALRLAPVQITKYNEIIVDPDPLQRFQRLESISKDFGAFPPFWYHKGSAAREIYQSSKYEEISDRYKDEALNAFMKFEEIHDGMEFWRTDPIAASCALEHISLLDCAADAIKIAELLEKVIGNDERGGFAGDNMDVLQMCVPIYASIKKQQEMKSILLRLVNERYNVRMNGILLSRILRMEGEEVGYKVLIKQIGEANVLPWFDTEDEADQAERDLMDEIAILEKKSQLDIPWPPNLQPDRTEELFPEIREIVEKHAPAIDETTDFRRKYDEKRIVAFINKHSLNIETKTVIVLLRFLSDSKCGCLITTHAMYYAEYFEEAEKIAFKDIDFDKCKLLTDKKGKTSGLGIIMKSGETVVIKSTSSRKGREAGSNTMLNLLIEIGKIGNYAHTDASMPISEMGYTVKLPFVKYLASFHAYSQRSSAEAMRFACDIGFTDDQLNELADFIKNRKESDANILLQIDANVPYGSCKSLKYALMQEMYSQHFVAVNELSMSAPEFEFIKKTADVYGFDNKEMDSLKKLAQTKYKLLSGQIKSVSELKEAEKAIAYLAGVGGVPLATIIGSSFLAWKTIWLWFIPGIGFMLGAALAGFIAVKSIVNKRKKDAELSKQRREMIESEIMSYETAHARLSNIRTDMAYEVHELFLKKMDIQLMLVEKSLS